MSPSVLGRQAAGDIQDGSQGLLIPIIREDPFLVQRPQPFTYHVCAEDLTKTVIVPNLPAAIFKYGRRRAEFLLSLVQRVNIVLCAL